MPNELQEFLSEIEFDDPVDEVEIEDDLPVPQPPEERMLDDMLASRLVSTKRAAAITKPSAPIQFASAFAFEIALRYEPVAIILQRHGVDKEQFAQLIKHQAFIVAVNQFRSEIKKNGMTFKLKAKLLSEDLLDMAYILAKDPTVPAAVRTTNISNVVRWADLDPKASSATGAGGDANQFNIQINL